MESSGQQELPGLSGTRYTPEQLAAMPAVERVRYYESLSPEEWSQLLTDSLVQGLNAKAKAENPD